MNTDRSARPAPSSALPAPGSQCYLVTGAAGFIAAKVCEMLLAEGHTVVGVDNLNDYYDVRLKRYRLGQVARLAGVPEAEVIRHGLSVTSEKFTHPITNHQSPITSHQSPITNHGSPITLKSDRFEFVQMDIEDLPALERIFARSNFTAVFNLAARAGVRYSIENPHVYLSTNTLGTLNILECMRKHGVRKHVLASTSSLYAGCPMPFTEDQPVNTPLSPYAATKKAAEMLSWTWHKIHGIDTTVLRYFTVFGPAGRPDMAPFRFVHWVATGQPIKLFGDGTATRDFTYVDDIARGTILAAGLRPGPRPLSDGGCSLWGKGASQADPNSEIQNSQSQTPNPRPELQSSGFEVINLGGGNRPITINAMIALIEKELNAAAGGVLSDDGSVLSGNIPGKQQPTTSNRQPTTGASNNQQPTSNNQTPPFRAQITYLPPNPVDMTDTQADITKAGRLLGWKPEVTPEEGFRRTVEWYFANRNWLKDVNV